MTDGKPMNGREEFRLLCPVCQLDLVISHRQGIEIDYCRRCRGVWLDRWALEKVIACDAALATQAICLRTGGAGSLTATDALSSSTVVPTGSPDAHAKQKASAPESSPPANIGEKQAPEPRSFLQRLFQ
jgi:hypothetical protein